MSTPSTLFLTGANGYIGRVVGERLVAAGYRVRGLVRKAEQAPQIVAAGMFPVIGDLLDSDCLDQATHGVDAIVHTASFGPLPEGDLGQQLNTAMRAMSDLAQRSARLGVRLVLTSGGSAYGDRSHAPADETTHLDREGFFGPLAELEESLGQQANITIIRAGIVYGRGASKPLLASLAPIRQLGSAVRVEAGHRVAVVHVDDLADLYVKTVAASAPPPVLIGAADMVETEAIMAAAANILGYEHTARSIPPERAADYSVLGIYTSRSMWLNSAVTQSAMAWRPHRMGIEDDIREGSYPPVLHQNLQPFLIDEGDKA
ncbi:MAG: NAD-dependent epimerase/dehydratase family protein [Pseudomonadota bacterium]